MPKSRSFEFRCCVLALLQSHVGIVSVVHKGRSTGVDDAPAMTETFDVVISCCFLIDRRTVSPCGA
jgi:hypothetical protein